MSLQLRLALTVMATLAVPLTVAAVLLALLLPGSLSSHVNSETLTARTTLRTLINQQCNLLEQTATSVAAVSTLNNLKDSATASSAVDRGAADGVFVLDEQGRTLVKHQRNPVGLTADLPSLITRTPDCSAGPTPARWSPGYTSSARTAIGSASPSPPRGWTPPRSAR